MHELPRLFITSSPSDFFNFSTCPAFDIPICFIRSSTSSSQSFTKNSRSSYPLLSNFSKYWPWLIEFSHSHRLAAVIDKTAIFKIMPQAHVLTTSCNSNYKAVNVEDFSIVVVEVVVK